MTQRNDGGPAFPVAAGPKDGYGNPTNAPQRGMTKREWLAGQALAGILAFPGAVTGDRNKATGVVVKAAVSYADALLAELAK